MRPAQAGGHCACRFLARFFLAQAEYDPARASPEKIVEAINNLGYKASVKD